jgi:hypothetical protein
MKRLWACGMTALILGVSAAAIAADDTSGSGSPFNGAQNQAFTRWGAMPPARPKAPPTPAAAAAKARANDTAEAVRAQEEANFLRRLAVCDKLQRMANETGDESLEKQAFQLQEKAARVYQQRTAAPTDDTPPSDDKPRGKKR